MIIRHIKQRPVQQQVSVDMEGIYAQQSLTRRAAERVAGRLRYEAEWLSMVIEQSEQRIKEQLVFGKAIAKGLRSLGSFGALKAFQPEKRMREQLGFGRAT